MIDRPGLDTQLARALHQRSRLSTGPLRAALDAARAARPGGPTLARRLVEAGALGEEEVVRVLEELGAPSGSLAHSLEESAVVGPQRDPWQPGTRLGDLRLVERLGAGAMGQVWTAEHVRSGARFAVKTYPLDAEEEQVLRFRREGEAQARVDGHPNVVRIHTLAEDREVCGGRAYTVMDLAPGGDLDARVRRDGPLPPEEAAVVLRDLARGLAHLHRQGVLHRDLKPANVLFDERGAAKLVDFGLARLEGTQSLTRTGDLIGTPAFMPPEQALGHRERVGPASDVYALGAVLFFALTGAPPVAGRQVLEVLQQVVEGPVPSPRDLAPGVPAALDGLCRQALAKEPAARPTAEAFAEVLDAFLSGEAAASQGGGLGWVVAGAAAGAVIAVAAVAALLLPVRGEPEPAGPAPAPSAEPAAVAGPAAAPVAPPLWPAEAGDAHRFRLEITGTSSSSFQQDAEVHYRRLLDLLCTTEEATPTALRLRARLERLVLHQGVKGYPLFDLSFDSEDPQDAHQPPAAAVGLSYAFTLDPRTGAVSDLTGASGLHRAIEAAVDAMEVPPQMRELNRRRYMVLELSDDHLLEKVLDDLLGVTPQPGEAAWTRRIEQSPAAGRVLGFGTVPVEVQVARAPAQAGERRFTWEGEADDQGADDATVGRAVRGEARFDARGLVLAQVDERWRGRVRGYAGMTQASGVPRNRVVNVAFTLRLQRVER